jgi:hypothetical protein
MITELLMRVPERELSDLLVGGMAIGCTTIVFLTAILSRLWGRYSQRQMAVPLMQAMLDRGMSVDEIEEVFAAAWSVKPRGLAGVLRNASGRPGTPVVTAGQ